MTAFITGTERRNFDFAPPYSGVSITDFTPRPGNLSFRDFPPFFQVGAVVKSCNLP